MINRLSSPSALAALAALFVASATFSYGEEFEAIESKTAKDYVRKMDASGAFVPETYVFGEGDDWRGARVDSTIDDLNFMDVARSLARSLAKKGYFPAADQKSAEELVIISWGTTRAPEHATESAAHREMINGTAMQEKGMRMIKDAHSQAELQAGKEITADANNELAMALSAISLEDARRDDTDMRNATLLGYDSWWMATASAMDGSPLGHRKKDMMDELEEDRYFIVMTAFDYHTIAKGKKPKFLWEVRLSIREHTNQFDTRLEHMLAIACDYYGRNSNGLDHVELPPAGHVEIGKIQSLGAVTPGK